MTKGAEGAAGPGGPVGLGGTWGWRQRDTGRREEQRTSDLSPGGEVCCGERQAQREPPSELVQRELGCRTRILWLLGSEGLGLDNLNRYRTRAARGNITRGEDDPKFRLR